MPRRPPHFKVFASAANHRKMRGVWDDDAVLAMWVRAGVLALQRFADRTSDSCLVSRRDLLVVAGTEPWVNAQRKLRRLVAATPLRVRCDCAASPLEGRCDCAGLWLDFPNFAEKQGFGSGNGKETVSSSSSTSSSTSKKSQRRASRAAPKQETDPQALAFTADFIAALERVHPGFDPPGESARNGWATQARLLLAKRGNAEARAVAKWLFDETNGSEDAAFWRSVVLSVTKFRAKFDQIAARKRQEERRGGRQSAGAGNCTSPLAERARAEIRRLQAVGGGSDGGG